MELRRQINKSLSPSLSLSLAVVSSAQSSSGSLYSTGRLVCVCVCVSVCLYVSLCVLLCLCVHLRGSSSAASLPLSLRSRRRIAEACPLAKPLSRRSGSGRQRRSTIRERGIENGCLFGGKRLASVFVSSVALSPPASPLSAQRHRPAPVQWAPAGPPPPQRANCAHKREREAERAEDDAHLRNV